MRIIMMGTGPFAVPTLEALYHTSHEVVALVTQPPREPPKGRRAAPINPMRVVAEAYHTPVFMPEKINKIAARKPLLELQADILVVADYGQILNANTLAMARFGGINLHAALLPKYRGAAPIQWAIYHGDHETGVSIIQMTPELDGGPCIAQLKVAIGPDETAEELEPRLAEVGALVVCQTLDRLSQGTIAPLPQDSSQVTLAPRLQKSDGAIDWSRPAAAIRNQIRAFIPWPKCYTHWLRPDGEPLRMIVGPIRIDDTPTTAAPGEVVIAKGTELAIATGHGIARLTEVQPAGKRAMHVAEFLNGHAVQVGARFGDVAGE